MGSMCTAVFIGWDPLFPQHLGSYTRALLISQDRRHLTPLVCTIYLSACLVFYLKNGRATDPCITGTSYECETFVKTHLGICCARRRIILYIKYQSICPFVRLAPPPPLSRKRVCPPPLWNQGGHPLAVEGTGEPIRTTGEKAWRSVYSVVVGKRWRLGVGGGTAVQTLYFPLVYTYPFPTYDGRNV